MWLFIYGKIGYIDLYVFLFFYSWIYLMIKYGEIEYIYLCTYLYMAIIARKNDIIGILEHKNRKTRKPDR